jgi:hypothetical protein
MGIFCRVQPATRFAHDRIEAREKPRILRISLR